MTFVFWIQENWYKKSFENYSIHFFHFLFKMKHWSICKRVQNSELKISWIVALLIISLQIRKSPLKIKTANCCLLLTLCCFWNLHWGYSTSLFLLLKALLVIVAMRFVKNIFPLMINCISILRQHNGIWRWGMEPFLPPNHGNYKRYDSESFTRCWYL